MEFKKYMHIEKFGNCEVEGIEFGKCFVFPKLDGSSGSVWVDDKLNICCGSRNRQLSLEDDNAGFCKYIYNDDRFMHFLSKYPKLKLFGEWLVPHSFKKYQDDVWRKFYVFDVINEIGNYLSYDAYKSLLEEYHLDYIPPLRVIDNPRKEQLENIMKNDNVFYVKEGEGVGEGIVIKNYDYRNKYGRICFAKMVTNEFKEKHSRILGAPEVKGKDYVENKIVNEFLTFDIVEKIYQKIINDEEGWSSKCTYRLLSTVYHDFIKEELWRAIKKLKNPVIDFKVLNRFVTNKTKELKKDLF